MKSGLFNPKLCHELFSKNQTQFTCQIMDNDVRAYIFSPYHHFYCIKVSGLRMEINQCEKTPWMSQCNESMDVTDIYSSLHQTADQKTRISYIPKYNSFINLHNLEIKPGCSSVCPKKGGCPSIIVNIRKNFSQVPHWNLQNFCRPS